MSLLLIDGRRAEARPKAGRPRGDGRDGDGFRAALLRTAEVLDLVAPEAEDGELPPEPRYSDYARSLHALRCRAADARDAVSAAEQSAAEAAQWHDDLRWYASLSPAPPAGQALSARRSCWRRLGLTVLGAGTLLGVLCLALTVVIFLSPGPLLVLPAAAALAAVIKVTVVVEEHERNEHSLDLAAAALAVREAQDSLGLARERAAALRAECETRMRRGRAEAAEWCACQQVPADASSLRRLAAPAEAVPLTDRDGVRGNCAPPALVAAT